MNLDKHNIKYNLLCLSDKVYQQVVWFGMGREGGLFMSSLNETISMLFDDTELAKELDKGEIVFNVAIDSMLLDLLRKLLSIDFPASPDDILHGDLFCDIRLLSASILVSILQFESTNSNA